MPDNIIAAAAQRMKEHQQATQRLKWFIAMYEELSVAKNPGPNKPSIAHETKRPKGTRVYR